MRSVCVFVFCVLALSSVADGRRVSSKLSNIREAADPGAAIPPAQRDPVNCETNSTPDNKNGGCKLVPLNPNQCTCVPKGKCPQPADPTKCIECASKDTCVAEKNCDKLGVTVFFDPSTHTLLNPWAAMNDKHVSWPAKEVAKFSEKDGKKYFELTELKDDKDKQAWCKAMNKPPVLYTEAEASAGKLQYDNKSMAGFPKTVAFFSDNFPAFDNRSNAPKIANFQNWEQLPVCFGFGADISAYLLKNLKPDGSLVTPTSAACRRLSTPYWSELVNLRLLDCVYKGWLGVGFMWATDQNSTNPNRTPVYRSTTGGELCYAYVAGKANSTWQTTWNGLKKV